MMGLRRAMDRLFDDAMVSSPGWDNVSRMELAMDVSESDDAYTVKASIPGVSPDDIDITYNANTLTIKGELKEEKEVQEARYHLRERRFGSFSRSINLPSTIDASGIQANYEKGVLTLSLPKAEEAKPKRIEIKTQKMIEGEMKDK
jgi:HSP20 family protein